MNAYGITLDVDWAPDCAIEEAASSLIRHGVKATWFITHDSPALGLLRQHPQLFELGIHPNFLAGSSHGNEIPEVLDHVMSIVPEARSLRTHDLYQSSRMFRTVLQRTPIQIDMSLFLQGQTGSEPFVFSLAEGNLTRIPYFWEDDIEAARSQPNWNAASYLGPGLRVFDFHPIHVALNSSDMNAYERLKAEVPQLSRCSPEQLARHRHSGAGGGELFHSLVQQLGSQQTYRAQDLKELWQG